MGRIIVIEDNIVFSDYVCGLLRKQGFRTSAASDCANARKLLATVQDDDIILADLRLPDGDGILLLEWLRKAGKRNPYIIMTDYAEVPTAVKSMKLGAEDYIPKKLLEDGLPPMIHGLQKKLERDKAGHAPIHERQSDAFRKIDRRIGLVANTNINVLVLGENGTGKEHIAEKIHSRSNRSAGPFVTVDCGLLSKELAASVLFGHEKGAFTGAQERKAGYWEEADGGTLFLDEAGNLPVEVQQMLLRAMQTKQFRPVGGNRDKTADVRIVAATNEDLPKAIEEKRFRQDLYFRLKEFVIHVPPLRECREDIMPLADFFCEQACKEMGKQVRGFDAESKELLLSHVWSGNVRELRQAVQAAVLLCEGETVTAGLLELENTVPATGSALALKDGEMEKEKILRALEKAGGNRKLAAELLGIGRTTLYNKIRLYGMKYKE